MRHTLLHLICQHLEATGQSAGLVSFLQGVEEEEEETVLLPENPSPKDRTQFAFDQGYTVNEKAPGQFVFNDPHGNDADNGPWPTEDEAWAAAYDDLESMILLGEEVE
jgi:hypothetical protein